MNRLPFLAQRVFNTPIALHPQKAEIVMAALAERLGVTQLVRVTGQTVALLPPDLDEDDRADARPYQVAGGIARIAVQGTLVQRNGLQPWSGMTGYDGVRAQLAMALQDDEVEAVALDIDSPGGEVAGCFDLVDAIYAARGGKPIWAILNEAAYSAAYAIASACDRITVPRTGGTGSIGVIAMLVDMSKALERGGMTVNIVRFGANKCEGNPYEALSDEARDRIQSQIDTMGELFIDTVARNRGLAASTVRDTQARTFLGADGVALGLADEVMAPDFAFRALHAQLA